jgi:alanine dehydrogenase/PNT-like protein
VIDFRPSPPNGSVSNRTSLSRACRGPASSALGRRDRRPRGQGGNCEPARPDEIVVEHGVTIIGTVNLAGAALSHASQMYTKNVAAFILHLAKGGALRRD